MKPDKNIIFDKGIHLDDLHFWMDVSANDQEAFLFFWQIAQDHKHAYSWRALWVVEHAINKNKDNIDLILPQLFHLLLETENNSTLRIGLKLAIIRPLKSNDTIGMLFNKCESMLLDSKCPIATRSNCLQFIHEFCKVEPDLNNELLMIIDTIESQEPSSGMKARLRKIKASIHKINSQK